MFQKVRPFYKFIYKIDPYFSKLANSNLFGPQVILQPMKPTVIGNYEGLEWKDVIAQNQYLKFI